MKRVSPIAALVLALLVGPAARAQAQDDHARIDALERRVRELEQKLSEQRAAPAAQAAAPAAPAAPPQAAVPAPAPATRPEKPKPLDVREPPFANGDYSWLNGSNNQPSSLLTVGPLTWTVYIDAYYAYQFHAPIDHTIFPSTVAPRHNEISFNLGVLGVEITGLDGPIGRLYVQYGANVDTIAGQDPTVTRGYFLSASVFKYVEQAAVGWHFHWLHGVNAEIGIFPSYIGLESYLPQENWNYTHAFVADFTPFYFFGGRIQLFPTALLKIELWLVNGWQTFGQWHEAKAGGYSINWRPRDYLSLVNSFYIGEDVPNDPDALRPYSDNSIQIRYYKGKTKRQLSYAALSLIGDVGYQTRSAPALGGWMGGAALANRVAWRAWLATTVRGDIFYDQRGSIITHLPVGDPYSLPSSGPYLLGGVTITQDFQPSPWVLFRLEYSHRESNQPYLSGHGGITGPNGVQGPAVPGFVPDLVKRDDRLLVNATLRL